MAQRAAGRFQFHQARRHGARDSAIAILDRIHEADLAANISVNLTQMGLDLDPELAADNMCAILERTRSYVPFGTDWYPYLMRRLAERPASLAFIAGNIVRETFAQS